MPIVSKSACLGPGSEAPPLRGGKDSGMILAKGHLGWWQHFLHAGGGRGGLALALLRPEPFSGPSAGPSRPPPRAQVPGGGAGQREGREGTAPGSGPSPAVELPHAVQLRGLGPGQDHLPSQLHGGGPPGTRPRPAAPGPALPSTSRPLATGSRLHGGLSPGGGARVVRGGPCEPIGHSLRGEAARARWGRPGKRSTR